MDVNTLNQFRQQIQNGTILPEQKRFWAHQEKEIIKEYSNQDITVVWKPKTCTHSKNCWKGLLQVFNPQNRPWINMDGASTERIKKQIAACPSGALSYRSNKEGDQEALQLETAIRNNDTYMVKRLLDLHPDTFQVGSLFFFYKKQGRYNYS